MDARKYSQYLLCLNKLYFFCFSRCRWVLKILRCCAFNHLKFLLLLGARQNDAIMFKGFMAMFEYLEGHKTLHSHSYLNFVQISCKICSQFARFKALSIMTYTLLIHQRINVSISPQRKKRINIMYLCAYNCMPFQYVQYGISCILLASFTSTTVYNH